MWNRRQFIKALGVLGGAVAAPLHRLGRAQAAAPRADLPPGAELYGGFLLLPEGVSLPSFVQLPRYGPPVVCGVGPEAKISERMGITQSVDTAEALAEAMGVPVYKLSPIPEGLRASGGTFLRHADGVGYGGSISYETFDADSRRWENTITIGAQVDFAKPFPLRTSQPKERKEQMIVHEKDANLPSPGIRVETKLGFVFLWIEDDILYTLIAEHSKNIEVARILISSLVRVG